MTVQRSGTRPRIITHVQTETAPTADGAVTTPVHRALAAKGLLPAQHGPAFTRH